MFRKVILGVVALLIALIVWVYYNSGNIVRSAVVTYGPKILGVGVELGAVEFSLSEGTGEIKAFAIKNPKGFSEPYAFKVDSISFFMDMQSLSTPEVLIHDINIVNPAISFETNANGENNLDWIAKHTGKQTTSKHLKKEAASEPASGEAKSFVIEQVQITGATVTPKFASLGTAINLPAITLKDLGKDKSLSAEEVVHIILGAITKNVDGLNLKAVANKAMEKLQGDLNEKLKGATEDLNNKAIDAAKQVNEKLGADLEKGINNLLGGEKQ